MLNQPDLDERGEVPPLVGRHGRRTARGLTRSRQVNELSVRVGALLKGFPVLVELVRAVLGSPILEAQRSLFVYRLARAGERIGDEGLVRDQADRPSRFCVAVLPLPETLHFNEKRRIDPIPNSAPTVPAGY
jgi:hypothetical protein